MAGLSTQHRSLPACIMPVRWQDGYCNSYAGLAVVLRVSLRSDPSHPSFFHPLDHANTHFQRLFDWVILVARRHVSYQGHLLSRRTLQIVTSTAMSIYMRHISSGHACSSRTGLFVFGKLSSANRQMAVDIVITLSATIPVDDR